MCRWFAYISRSEPCLLEDVLVNPAHSLAKQVSEHYLPKLTYYEPDEDAKSTEKEIALRNRLFNEGFMKQLQLYYEMTMPDNLDQSPAYQRWLYQREVELSRAYVP